MRGLCLWRARAWVSSASLGALDAVPACWETVTARRPGTRTSAYRSMGHGNTVGFAVGLEDQAHLRLDRSDLATLHCSTAWSIAGLPWRHMLQAFVITLREGLEAFLIVAISLAYLK